MSIDRKRLQEAITRYEQRVNTTELDVLVEAAKAHLATLPPEPRKPTLADQACAVETAVAYLPTPSTLAEPSCRAAAATLRSLDEFRKAWYSEDGGRDDRYDLAQAFLISLGLVDSLP